MSGSGFSIFEAIGFAFVIFFALTGAVSLFGAAWFGIATARRQRHRGQIEEELDIQRELRARDAIEKGTR